MNHTLKAIWERIAQLWRPAGMQDVEQEAAHIMPPPAQSIAPPSAETVRQSRSVDKFVNNTARERERLEARLDRQLSLMTGGRFRVPDDDSAADERDYDGQEQEERR